MGRKFDDSWYIENGKCFNKDGTEITSRTCIKCGKVKLFEEFVSDNRRKYGVQGECKDCVSIRRKVYVKEYNSINRDYVIEKKKEYREKHKDAILEKQKEYRKRNKHEIIQRQKQYSLTIEGVETIRRARHKRKALKLKNGGSYTSTQWEDCKDFFNNNCAYSGQPIDCTNTHIEHIRPLSKGGTSYIWNICPSLNTVNFSKGNKDMEKWYRKQEYFCEERLQKIYEWQDLAYSKYFIL